ncbi:MAG: amidohydrolase family protein [Planctomycetota bacterium]
MLEAHAHVFQLGRALTMVDLSGCATKVEMLERLGARASEKPESAILAHGARPEGFLEPGWPSIDELERACNGAAVWVWCFDHHALFASRAALAAAGVDESTTNPRGGMFERDADGRLTGVCKESAALRLWAAAPEPAEADRAGVVRAALESLATLGFTEVHDLKAQPWLPGVLRGLERDGALACDVVCWPLVEDLAAMSFDRERWESDRVRLGGGKVFVDGTLNSRTAWMLAPYADGDPKHPAGMALMSAEDLDAALAVCAHANVPMAAHAIGDGAVRAVLDAIERADEGALGATHRIEHAELVHESDVRRFVDLGVVASVQPCHLLPDIEALQRAVPDRLDRVLPIRELIDAGCAPGRLDGPGVVFGSDVPIVRADPGDSITAAVERGRGDGSGVIGAGQAISEAEAWGCFGVSDPPRAR